MPLTAADIEPALLLWPGLHGAQAHLVNHSENQTFFIKAPSSERFSLRVHRPGYQSLGSIQSEMEWLAAVQRDTGLSVPIAVAGFDGRPVQQFISSDGEPRCAVLFCFIDGSEPRLDSGAPALFHALGRIAATLHNHASDWRRPNGFERPVWDARAILAHDGLWGDWRSAPHLDEASQAILLRLAQTLEERLFDYGTGADRFGLIHADMRLGNLLADGERLTVIDFDDCGFGWFAYDFAAAISFYESNPSIPALKAAWLEGYAALRRLTPADTAMLDTMVMLRRMALLAWICSHGETRLAQDHQLDFATGTVALARRYLDNGVLWPA